MLFCRISGVAPVLFQKLFKPSVSLQQLDLRHINPNNHSNLVVGMNSFLISISFFSSCFFTLAKKSILFVLSFCFGLLRKIDPKCVASNRFSQEMKSEWIIGPCALSYAVILYAGSYVAGLSKMDLSWAVLRYGRILCKGEVDTIPWSKNQVWRFFTPLFCMGYPVYGNLYHIVLL